MLELVAPSRFRAVAVVPVFNHAATVGAVVVAARDAGLRCILVDDGSEPACARTLDELEARFAGSVDVLRLAHNEGKGAAVVVGLREADRQGCTHALQIDADGQHDLADLAPFVARARRRPDAVICGCPAFDATVPGARLMGRYITRFFVWVETRSFDIVDSMCGFRVYPLAQVMPLIDEVALGKRMDFDTDVLVRLHWRGVPIVSQWTKVTYPPGGVSHFRMWRDNALICLMHVRLLAAMWRPWAGRLRTRLRASSPLQGLSRKSRS